MISIRKIIPADETWVTWKMVQDWGSEIVVVHGDVYHPAGLPGFIAEMDGEKVGLLTYHIRDDACEIVTLNSWQENAGVGSALIDAAREAARQVGCCRLWLVTTNDNLHALHFCQKQGFTISDIRVNAVERSRQLKPEIPLLGYDGIPLRDEIELEILLTRES